MSLIRFGVSASNYSEAITAAGELLVAKGFVKPSYVSAMIRVVEELGPYIVLVDGFALAHAAPGEDVVENAISVAVLENPVDFGSGKMVKVVFALAAKDHSSHIDSLGALAELLADVENRNVLLNSSDSEQIRILLARALGE